MTGCNRFLHTINIHHACEYSYLHAPNINVHVSTPIDPKCDPSAELTLPLTSVLILVFYVNFL